MGGEVDVLLRSSPLTLAATELEDGWTRVASGRLSAEHLHSGHRPQGISWLPTCLALSCATPPSLSVASPRPLLYRGVLHCAHPPSVLGTKLTTAPMGTLMTPQISRILPGPHGH